MNTGVRFSINAAIPSCRSNRPRSSAIAACRAATSARPAARDSHSAKATRPGRPWAEQSSGDGLEELDRTERPAVTAERESRG